MYFRMALQPKFKSLMPRVFCHCLVLVTALILPVLANLTLGASQTAQEIIVLELGKPIERELSGGQRHRYEIPISEGQFVRLEIRQQGISISASLQGPDGKTISRVGHPYTMEQEPTIDFVAESSGNYVLEIYAGAKAPIGRYDIRVAQLHRATEDDHKLQQARKFYDEYLTLNREGKPFEARSLLMRVLEIREKVLGPDSLPVAVTLDRLSGSYALTGDYASAVPLRERALRIKEEMLGQDHPDVAYTLLNLGIVYQEMGDDFKADQANQRALTIYEKVKQTENMSFAALLLNIGDAYYNRGDYEGAEKRYQRARAIQEKILGPDHFHLASSFASLGLVAYSASDYSSAENMFQRALMLAEKNLGPDHVKVTRYLNNLAMVYATTGDYGKAEALYRRAFSISEEKAAIGSLDAQESLFGLARLYAAQGMIPDAVKFQARANEIEERYVEVNLAAGSDRDKLTLLSSLAAHAFRNISLHARLAPNDREARNLAMTTILQRKGRAQDAMSASFAALHNRLGADDKKLLDQLNEVNAKLANLSVNGPQKVTVVEHQRQVKALDEERERLEVEVSRRSAGFYRPPVPVELGAIQSAIPEQAALIEFAVYEPFDSRAPDSYKAYGEPRYVAYVAHSKGEIQWKELGEARPIDEAINALRLALLDPRRNNVQQLSRALDEKVMQPLNAFIGDAKQLLVSPDGPLNLVPFEALVNEDGKYLIEQYSINYLTSGRDLLRLQTPRQSKTDPLVIADPTFGEPKEVQTKVSYEPKPLKSAHRPKQSITTARDLSSMYFASLSGTAQEARAIKSLFPEADVLTGEQATESALKQVLAPRILHIATHGFFLSDAPNSDNGISTHFLNGMMRIPNPLLRSGLALTGANLRKSIGEDGILTALEASGLNLWGTRLVTLSACDTGLGEIRTGEGVYGLRRALVLAGAETSVMSLWPVSDYVTRELMTAFYRGLRQGKGRAEALRQVQLNMLKRKDRRHPFYWASFIQSGEWANLDGKR